MSDSNFNGVLDPDAGWPDIPQASTQFVVLGGPGGPLNEQALALVARIKKLKADVENISGGGFGGQYKNLVVTVSGVGYQGTITANRLVVESVDFKSKVLRDVNVAFNGANIGVNGMDVNSITAGTWYNLFVIYNPATDTTSSLVSLSNTAPTLPAGYTYYCRVGTAYVPAATTAFMAQEQKDRIVSFGVGGTQGCVLVLNGGTNTSITSISLSTAMPPTASRVCLLAASANGGPCNLYSDATSLLGLTSSNSPNFTWFIPKVSATVYYRMTSGNGYVRVFGYEDML